MVTVESIDRTNHGITPEEVIPLLNKYGMLSRLAYEDIIEGAISQIHCSPSEIAIVFKRCQQYIQKAPTSELARREFLVLAIRKLKLEKFKRQKWSDRIPAYFARRKRQLDRVVYSIVTTKSKAVAREMYFRLIEGEQTITELSQDEPNSQIKVRGSIGWVELSTLPPVIGQQLSSLKVNSITAPFTVGNCYVILRLEKYVSAQCDRAMHQRLTDELFQQWMQQQLRQHQYHLVSDSG